MVNYDKTLSIHGCIFQATRVIFFTFNKNTWMYLLYDSLNVFWKRHCNKTEHWNNIATVCFEIKSTYQNDWLWNRLLVKPHLLETKWQQSQSFYRQTYNLDYRFNKHFSTIGEKLARCFGSVLRESDVSPLKTGPIIF